MYEENTKIYNHLIVLIVMVSKLEAIGVKIDDKEKTLWFIWSPSSSYEHMKPIMMNEKAIVVFLEVTSELFTEERRLSGGGGGSNVSFENSTLTIDTRKRNFKKKNIICWVMNNLGILQEIIKKVE